MRQCVFLGCGPAGRAAARDVRRQAPKGEVTLVSREFTAFHLGLALTNVAAGALGRREVVVQDLELSEDPGVAVRAVWKVALDPGVKTEYRRLAPKELARKAEAVALGADKRGETTRTGVFRRPRHEAERRLEELAGVG